jgi:hypothetical protein
MTHDELLALIDDSTNGLKHDDLFEKLLTNTKALRAVVELHKPFEIDREGNYNCQECEWQYPCPTIQSIEKELQ